MPHESDILRPKDPILIDDNEWPEFLLTNAEVYDARTEELVSLLHADEYSPVNVRGKLEGLHKSQVHLLLKPSYHRTIPLEITGVDRYSYGIYDDGGIDVWATGLAGHFKIQPSRAYKHIYKDMVEAVRVLYFIADLHRGQSGKPKTMGKMAPSAQNIFSEYSREATKCANAQDAANIIYKHRQFLFTCMALGKEDIVWEQTPFYKHMAEKFPVESEAAKPQNRRFKRKRNARSKDDTCQTNGLTSNDVEVADAHTKPNILERPAQNLRPRRRGRPPKNESLPDPKSTPVQQIKSVQGENGDSSEDSETPFDPRLAKKGRGHGKSTSALRPKTVMNIPQMDGPEDEDVSESPVPVYKRKNSDMLERQPAKRVLRNNPSPDFDEDEAIDMPSDDDNVEMPNTNNLGSQTNKSAALPLRWKTDAQAGGGPTSPPFTITTERFPSGIPQWPGDVWACTYDGCLRKVYGASKDLGKGLVDEHLRTHSKEGEERVELVRKEGELAAGLPVRYR
ncbi:MAG: hypothetical protein M1821_000352 [Bathelium mastoideum]|nr:MAG: hypothetical protein M1821_000352 [Bathelium mastoideum]